MIKGLIVTAAAVVILVGAVLVYAMTKPDTFRVERSATIKASAERIFPLINDFRSWGSWSPYEKLDPEMKRTLSGSISGEGAIYEWEGNGKVGKGRMEIMQASFPSRVLIKLDFVRPFESHNTAEFTLKPNGKSTDVTWTMTGPNLFIGKVMGLFVNMDTMIGKDFEAGLANLKNITEG